MRDALSYSAGQAIAQLGMSLLRGDCLIEDEPLELINKYLYYDFRVRASFLETQINWQ